MDWPRRGLYPPAVTGGRFRVGYMQIESASPGAITARSFRFRRRRAQGKGQETITALIRLAESFKRQTRLIFPPTSG